MQDRIKKTVVLVKENGWDWRGFFSDYARYQVRLKITVPLRRDNHSFVVAELQQNVHTLTNRSVCSNYQTCFVVEREVKKHFVDTFTETYPNSASQLPPPLVTMTNKRFYLYVIMKEFWCRQLILKINLNFCYKTQSSSLIAWCPESQRSLISLTRNLQVVKKPVQGSER